MCLFYILYSHNIDSYYVGHSCDEIESRLRKHNTNHKGYTGKSNDWEIVFSECYATKSEAYKREMEVKRWKSRKKIEMLITSAGKDHPG